VTPGRIFMPAVNARSSARSSARSTAATARLTRRQFGRAAALPLLAGTLGACGYGSQAQEDTTADAEPAVAGGRVLSATEVRIGYFANLTHGTALVGLAEDGLIRRELGGSGLATQTFNAGPTAIEALNAQAVDLTFVGPSPAINGYVQSGGENLRIVCGAASGGVALVGHPDRLPNLDDLAGKRLASPELGNTQDIALLGYLRDRGFDVEAETGRGEVEVLRIENSEIPAAFDGGDVDGAWVPEPTASKLVDLGGEVLLDEGKLWPNERYIVTHLAARQDFLDEHPDVVEAVVRGIVRTNVWITDHAEQAKSIINSALKELTTEALPVAILDPAFSHVEFLHDPLASTLKASAETAEEVGLLEEPDLDGIYDLTILNKVLRREGLPRITDDGGLGV
jgi:NitT/TauT family transport system substrate-binding protein